MLHPAIIFAAILTLIPYFAAAFFPEITTKPGRLPETARLLLPGLLSIPSVFVACSAHIFEWGWLALYALLPVVIAILLERARRADTNQLGNWRDFLVLAVLGLAV